MAVLKNHPGMFLNGAAAASLARVEDEKGRAIGISSAGRTPAEQQALINRWARGGAANRPPFLFEPARPASASPHVRNGGEAIDVPNEADRAWMKIHAVDNGWSFPIPSDRVHAVYNPANDRAANAVSSGDVDTRNRQTFLNTIGYSLKVDGIEGFETDQAIRGYQSDLTHQGFYRGAIDGIWGPQMETAHAAWVHANAKPAPAAPAAAAPAGNRFGLADVTGLQKVAKLHGYTGSIDNIWGSGSQAGFDRFLAKNHKGSLAVWLTRKYGYTGNSVYGPDMRAALARANAANKAAL